MSEICIYCGKEIKDEEPIPVMPGKIPGLKRERVEVEVPHTKKMIVMEAQEAKVVIDGEEQVVTAQVPVEKEVTYMKKREVFGKIINPRGYPIPYKHSKCLPKVEEKEAEVTPGKLED